MVRLAVEGGSSSNGGKSVIQKKITLPKNPAPAPVKTTAYAQTKKITTVAKNTAPKINPSSQSYYPPKQATGTQPTTVTTKERAAALNATLKSASSSSSSGSSKGSSGGSSGGSSKGSSSGSSGGSSSGAVTQVAPMYNPMTDPAYLASVAKLNDLWNTASGYKGQIDDLMKNGFTYDPTTDASYKALSELATKQAKTASNEAMETMNDRGILNSTVTGDRIAQVEQTAQDAVTAQIPNLKNAAYGQYMDKLSTLNNLWNSTTAQAQQERAFGEDKRRWDLGYQMDVDQFNTSKDQWNKTFDYNKSQDAFKNDLASGQLALDYQNYDLNYAKNLQSQIGVNNKQETNAALAELLKSGDKAQIISRLQSNVNTYYKKGVNLADLLKALNSYYPGIEDDANKAMNGKNIFDK